MSPLWFVAMDSVGRTAGSGASRWYINDVADILTNDAQLEVIKEQGAGFQRLAQLIDANTSQVQRADITFVLSLGNDLVQQCGRNLKPWKWPGQFQVISASLRSMAVQFRHQRHAIVFGGIP